MQVLEGPNGGQAVGWPAFHSSSVHASPLLYDIDSDGVRDILVATYDGQIVFYKDTVGMTHCLLLLLWLGNCIASPRVAQVSANVTRTDARLYGTPARRARRCAKAS